MIREIVILILLKALVFFYLFSLFDCDSGGSKTRAKITDSVVLMKKLAMKIISSANNLKDTNK